MAFLPGTTIKKEKWSGREFLDAMFCGTSGLVMSQIREFTGLNTPAIQNWINRGWLSHPENKRYNKDQVARILIINTLRETMSLENVARLLYYVNGVAGDKTDDIIPESELYGYVCDILFSDVTDDNVDEYIDGTVKNFRERKQGDTARLKKALKIVYLNCSAKKYITRSNQMLNELCEGG